MRLDPDPLRNKQKHGLTVSSENLNYFFFFLEHDGVLFFFSGFLRWILQDGVSKVGSVLGLYRIEMGRDEEDLMGWDEGCLRVAGFHRMGKRVMLSPAICLSSP